MKAFLIIFTLFLPVISVAQCCIEQKGSGDEAYFESCSEEIYKNDDLENGVLTYNCKSTLKRSGLELIVGCFYFRKAHVTPRQLKITFIKGESLLLQSSEIKMIPLQKGKAEACFFNIKPEVLNKLLSSELQKMVVIDNRTGKSFDITPDYKKLIPDQLYCLMND